MTFYKIHILGESNYLSHGILSDIRITVWHLHGSYGILLLFFCPELLAVHIQQMTENPSDDLQWSDSCLQETSWTSNGV